MGRKVSVFSSVVNLAGDEKLRPNYRKNTVLGGVLTKGKVSLGESIVGSYTGGPGITYRIFGRWARQIRTGGKQNYNQKIQYRAATVGLDMSGKEATLKQWIPNPLNGEVEILTVFADFGQYEYWADKWMLENKPDLINTAWTITYVRDTNTITINFVDGTSSSFVPVDFDQNQRYLFIKYRIKTDNPDWNYITEPAVTLPDQTEFPSMAGWTNMFEQNNPSNASVSRDTYTVSTFSDNRAPVTSTTTTTYSSEAITTKFVRYIRTVTTNTPGTDIFVTTYQEMYHNQYMGGYYYVTTFTDSGPLDIGNGVFRYDRYYTRQQHVLYTRTTQFSHQERGKLTIGPAQMLIYKYDSGNYYYDTILGDPDTSNTYLPFIPVYINNKFPSATYLPNIAKAAKVAYYRASRRQSLSKLQRKLKKNESLPDIDYAFCVFGVSLNVLDMACREYLYLFFNKMRLQYTSRTASLEQWYIDFEAAKTSVIAYEAWRNAQSNDQDPLYATPAPAVKAYPPVPEIKVRNYSADPVLGFDYTISWAGIKHEWFTGLSKAGAKKGDGHFEVGPVITREQLIPYEHWEGARILIPGETIKITTTYLYFQDEKDSYQKLTIFNLKHRNVVYEGHSVTITATEALASATESPFIVPLHEQIFAKEMSLTRSTQMCTACTFLVFNSYVVTKTSFWKSIFFIIVAIAIQMVTGVPIGEASGILGVNSAVGATIGFTAGSTAAAIAGAVLNSLAAIVVINIVSGVAIKVFGPELGAIFAAVAAILIGNPGLLDSFGSSMSTGFSELMKADNILKVTDAIGRGMQASNAAFYEDVQKQIAGYTAEAATVREAYYEHFQNSGVSLNTQSFLQSSEKAMPFMAEALENFLARTMMTGSDIAELSEALISDFADITLETEIG